MDGAGRDRGGGCFQKVLVKSLQDAKVSDVIDDHGLDWFCVLVGFKETGTMRNGMFLSTSRTVASNAIMTNNKEQQHMNYCRYIMWGNMET